MRRSLLLVGLVLSSLGIAQDRWPLMPGYKEMQAGAASGRDWKVSQLRGQWVGNTKYRFEDLDGAKEVDLGTGEVGALDFELVWPEPQPQRMPERGRQFETVQSADKTMTATYRNGNVILTRGGQEIAVTTTGKGTGGEKFGTGSWVYGEELSQVDAMGFSPDGKWLWYYGFDETGVPLYYIATDQLKQISALDIEAYPKPGTANPKVDLYVYSIETGQSKTVKVRDGEFDNGLGHYVYGMSWLDDSSELLYHRMDRRQKIRELVAYDPVKNSVRLVDREENAAAWVEFAPVRDMVSRPARQNPVSGRNFLFMSEADGFWNVYRLDVKTGRRIQVTKHRADVGGILGIYPENDTMYYTVGDGDTPYHHQVYRSKLDGTGAVRLTDPKFHNSASVSPDGKALAIVYQTDRKAPRLRIIDRTGKNLNNPVVKSFSAPAGDARQVRWFSFPSLDGSVTLWGKYELPSSYREGQKLPILFSVYGGPIPGRGAGMTFDKPDPVSEAGFAIVDVYVRGGNGRGRDFRNAIYRSMGIVEIDDFAAGAIALRKMPWADTSRVGIYGTSYGGYSSAMSVLRYPELFHAGSASSMVSDWRLYDSTYTERYMDLLEENLAGYDRGSCMTYAKDLKGWLMLYFGTLDNNTHPANTYQLSNALLKAGKYHELQAGVDQGHTGLNFARMMEFFTERLILNPKK